MIRKLAYWLIIIAISLFIPSIPYETKVNDSVTIVNYKPLGTFLYEQYQQQKEENLGSQ